MKKTYDIINQVFRFANLSSPASFAFRTNRSYRMNPPATFSKEDLAKIEKYLIDLERRQYSFGAAMALRFVMIPVAVWAKLAACVMKIIMLLSVR